MNGLLLNAQIPTRTEFFNVCDSLGIHHGNVVWAQARLESGNFQHGVYKTKHNCLGIYDSKKKEYSSFNNWIECVIAYRDKVQCKCKTPYCTDDEYLDWIIRMGYAADTSYRAKVEKIMKQETKNKK